MPAFNVPSEDEGFRVASLIPLLELQLADEVQFLRRAVSVPAVKDFPFIDADDRFYEPVRLNALYQCVEFIFLHISENRRKRVPLECAGIDKLPINDDNGWHAARWDTIPRIISVTRWVMIIVYLVPTITVYGDSVVLVGFRFDEVLWTPAAGAEFEVFRGDALEGWDVAVVVV